MVAQYGETQMQLVCDLQNVMERFKRKGHDE